MITFSNLNNKITKAANDALDDYKVFALWSQDVSKWYMDGIQVNGESNAYTPPRYWPTLGTVNFYAYAPASVVCNSTPGSVTLDYTVAQDADEDLTIAAPKKNQNKNNGVVELKFSHMLSKLTVNVELDNAKGGTLEGYNLDYSYTYVSLDYQTATFDVIEQSMLLNEENKGKYHYSIYQKDGEDSDKTIYVLPQPVDNEGFLDVKITVTDINFDNIVMLNQTVKKIKLTDIPGLVNGAFESGKWYKINVKITNEAKDDNDKELFSSVSFSASSEDWKE